MAETTEKKSCKRWGLKSPEQLRRLLTATVNQLLAETISREDARAVGFLCGILLDVFKFQKEADLDSRLEKLEALLADGNDNDEKF
jgi:hypothetical protein